MNKIFSILLCCLYLGASQTALFGNGHEPRPAVRELFPDTLPPTQPNSPTRLITIPGIPAAMQLTNRQAIQVRTPENVAQLHQAYIAQRAPRIVPSASIGTQFPNNTFSESELSSEDGRSQSPRPTQTIVPQNNLPASFFTQVHSNPRNFVGEARERHLNQYLNQSALAQRNVNAGPRVFNVARLYAARSAAQERNSRRHDDNARSRVLIMHLSRQNAARLRAAYRARQERNNRGHNYYDAQD